MFYSKAAYSAPHEVPVRDTENAEESMKVLVFIFRVFRACISSPCTQWFFLCVETVSSADKKGCSPSGRTALIGLICHQNSNL